MSTHRLPVSGLQVVVQQPTGLEDLLLQEATDLDMGLAFLLFDRLVRIARDTGGSTAGWGELSVTDVETLLLLLRREVLGDLIRAETKCAATGCKARIDVSFRIAEYLASQKPRIPPGVEKIEGEGTYRLAEGDVKFRLLNGEDLVALDRHAVSASALLQRCVRSAGVPARLRRRVVRAMQALAPRLSQTIVGECPECHATMNFYFDVMRFVLRELRDHAATIFEDVHLLAVYYKWPEEDILTLPRSRRLRYGAALRDQLANQGSAA
jgi:hypothetical protein